VTMIDFFFPAPAPNSPNFFTWGPHSTSIDKIRFLGGRTIIGKGDLTSPGKITSLEGVDVESAMLRLRANVKEEMRDYLGIDVGDDLDVGVGDGESSNSSA
jgi:hypothetical protein